MVLSGSVRPAILWLSGGAVTAVAIVTAVLCVVLIPRRHTAPSDVVNLLDLSADKRRQYLRSFDLVLSDCDGTVWDMTGSIPGAGDGVTALQEVAHKRVVFVSNNAMRSDASYLERFRHEGINVTMADVMHPGVAIVDYLRFQQFDGLIYLIGSTNLRRYLEAAGHRLVERAKGPTAGTDGSFAKYVQDGLPVDAVVMDWDSNLEVKQLQRAEAYLVSRPQCRFLVGATDEKLPFKPPIMGPGVVVRMLEEVVGRRATVIGKPGAELVSVVMQKYAVEDRRRILFVGDTLNQDIGFAKQAGFQTLVVLTGAASLESVQAAVPDERPDYYLPSFADFVEVCKDV